MTTLASATQQCFTGIVHHADVTYTKDDVLEQLWPEVGAAIIGVANTDAKFKAFLKTRGTCQMSCLEDTLMPALETIFGKLGGDLFSKTSNTHHLIDEALTGAFRACYPAPPLEEIAAVAARIREHIGRVEETRQGFPQGVACVNEGKDDEFPVNDFLKKFKATFMKTVAKNPEMQTFFDTKAKDCQLTCVDKTVPAAAKTLFLTDNKDDVKGVDALTGAIHACFPGLPHEDINSLVAATKEVMDASQDAARLRLYANNMVKSGSFSFFPLFGLVTAMSLLLFFTGVAVGSRWKRSSVREDNSTVRELFSQKVADDQEALIE